MSDYQLEPTPEQKSAIGRMLRFCLENKLVVAMMVLFVVFWGIRVAPFDWDLGWFPRDPVPTDAIPDIGENQQIVFTEWMGRSPQDVDDQISYPLTVSLLGVPEIKTIRSSSFFGFSSIYIIFKDGVDFYWARTRVLEKLNSLPAGTLPPGVQPALGPDATALGQIYWYTLEGMDPDGKPAGGWDLEELRTVQDWYVRYLLLSADGVAEVASVGGFVREYQVDVDPDAMRAYRVSLAEVARAVKASNIDVGAKVMELNRVEYFVRGIGFIKNVADIENSVVKVHENVPVLIKHVAEVTLGPALRRGMLDKGGAEAVGGVVVARYGDNPLAVIKNVKKKIKDEIADALPIKALIDFSRVTPDEIRTFAEEHGFDAYVGAEINQEEWQKYLKDAKRKNWPEWITTSKVTVVAFYDRTGLIYETLGTLRDSLSEEILITAIVVILMVMHLRSSILISGMLPLAVLLCFIAMSVFGVDANIVALSGIVIAIGTIVDMGIVVCENILRHLDEAPPHVPRLEVIHRAVSEVASAVITAVLTTIVSFLPVFTMMGAEGKLFKPLAFTKSFALLASIVIALTVLPPAAHILFCGKLSGKTLRYILHGLVVAVGVAAGFLLSWWAGMALVLFGAYYLLEDYIPARYRKFAPWAASVIAVLFIGVLLTEHWEPLGPERGMTRNLLFVGFLVVFLLGFFRLFQVVYPRLLRVCLRHKLLFMCLPLLLLAAGVTMWLGPGAFFGKISDKYLAQDFSEEQLEKLSTVERFKYGLVKLKDKKWNEPDWINRKAGWTKIRWTLARGWDGLGKEFMPPLDEGSYLFMPTTMVHASIGEAADILAKQDEAISKIPEVKLVVGKLGRAETPLDPAPISMIETVINYKPEYKTDKDGRRIKFKYVRREDNTVVFLRNADDDLIRDPDGLPFRQWRPHIKSPDDIWKEILKAAEIPGTTSASKLQPIAARIVMLQSGMRAPMGVKIKGPNLEVIEEVGLQIERYLKEIPSVEPSAVIADRIVGKPYLEIVPDRKAIARYGVPIRVFNDVVEIAVGGRKITTTVEGRERFPVRVRYQRELRDSIETLEKILVPASDGAQIPITELAEIRYVRGPQAIKSEDTFLIGYVVFDKKAGKAEVDVVEECQAYLQAKRDSGEFVLPKGVSYKFAGSYENQLRATRTLTIILPIALFIIFMIIYFQFKSVSTTLIVFSGIGIAWAGGFLLLWTYAQPWFLDFSVFGIEMRGLFQVHTINLSVAVWVGFLALFGIASDNGVIQSTYLDQIFRDRKPASIEAIREATIVAAQRRVRPCLMTSATTILALIPVLTSVGRGSDVMVPMAIPSFGGMTIVLISIFVVPVLYCFVKELTLRIGGETPEPDAEE